MSEPVTVADAAALDAARVLLAYHQQCLATAVLDIPVAHHQAMIVLLEYEIGLIPKRTAAREAARQRWKEMEAEGE